jgi:cytochrome c oxidase subunit 2
MAFVVVLVLLVVISVVFHFYSVYGDYWLTPIASEWTTIDFTIDITFWVTGFVFVAINLFMAYAVYRFRYNKDKRAHYEPENKKLETWLTLATSLGVFAMLAPGLYVWAVFVEPPKDADVFEAVGQQWQWNYRYPGADGVLGSADSTHVTPANPLGINADDPFGRDDLIVEGPVMHLPLNRPVKALLRSKDVLHNFTVTQFRVKMDLVPGLVSYLWLTPNKAGTYDILCEELCGIGHHVMRGKVVVEEEADYKAWLATLPTFADTQARVAGDATAGQANYAICAACHGAQGEGNPALNAPKLAGLDPWYVKRQIRYYQQGIRGAHEEDVAGQTMAPMAATLADETALNNTAAYITSLPDTPAEETINGNVIRGKKYFDATCGTCHGQDGSGIWAVNAPALAGMSDWYLVTQLSNYKKGIRGHQAGDDYGYQMMSMVSALKDQQAINDVVAYINTLR